MNNFVIGKNSVENAISRPVQTSVFDLIGELCRLTDDDNLVLAAVKNIFRSYTVRAVDSLAPVKLVATRRPSRRAATLRSGGRHDRWTAR